MTDHTKMIYSNVYYMSTMANFPDHGEDEYFDVIIVDIGDGFEFWYGDGYGDGDGDDEEFKMPDLSQYNRMCR